MNGYWQVSVVELCGEEGAQGRVVYGRFGPHLLNMLAEADTVISDIKSHPDHADEGREHPLAWEINVERFEGARAL